MRRYRRLQLAFTLSYRPLPRSSVDGESRPTLTVLVRYVDEESVAVVLHPNPMAGVPLFM